MKTIEAMSYCRALRCRECGKEYPAKRLTVCDSCFAPLDVVYDYDSIELSRQSFESRPRSIWRYSELLPVKEARSVVDIGAGYTPLRRALNLGSQLGLKNLYIKNDSVNPTFSFKDRPASVAISKAIEFGDRVVGCASTGNLAAAVAAHAAKANLDCYVFAPKDIERSKIAQVAAYGAKIIAVRGTYDDANRLAVLASEIYGWNLVNITSRPYYVEGSKTIAFEVAEQLGWRAPDHIIIPIASGALLCAIHRGFSEFDKLGLIGAAGVKVSGAQAEGCAPVANAFKSNNENIIPIEKPKTIATSIAIGDPGDGFYVLKVVRGTGGVVGSVGDGEILESIKLLAKTEGIFTEAAGAVTIGVLRQMVDGGKIDPDETVVCCVTGNGLKTVEHLAPSIAKPIELDPTLDALRSIKG